MPAGTPWWTISFNYSFLLDYLKSLILRAYDFSFKRIIFTKLQGTTVIPPVLTSNHWEQWLHEEGWHVLGYSTCQVQAPYREMLKKFPYEVNARKTRAPVNWYHFSLLHNENPCSSSSLPWSWVSTGKLTVKLELLVLLLITLSVF